MFRIKSALCFLSLCVFSAQLSYAASCFTGKDNPAQLEEGWKKFVDTGKVTGAEKTFQAGLKAKPGNAELLVSLATLKACMGKYDESFRLGARALESGEWGPWLEVQLGDLDNLLQYAKDTSPMKAAIEKRLKNRNIAWVERALLYKSLCGLLIARNEVDAAVKIFENEPVVKDWMMIGPFSNRERAGFDMEYDIEKELPAVDLNKEYKGRGRKIKWSRIAAPWDGEMDLDAIFHPGEESVAYLMTFVESKEDTDATVALGTGGATALWVNGEQIFREPDYHSFASLQRLVPVKLRKGVTQIVLKIAGERDGDFTAVCRVVPMSPEELQQAGSASLAEKRLKDMKISADEKTLAAFTASLPKKKKTEAAGAFTGLDWGAMKHFCKVVKADPQNALAMTLQSYLYMIYSLDDSIASRSRPLIEKAVKAAPNFPVALLMASLVQEDENSAREMLQKAAPLDTAIIDVRETMLEKKQAGGFNREAEKEARELLKTVESARVWKVLGGVEESREWKEEALSAYRKALAIAPGMPDLYVMASNLLPQGEKQIETLESGLGKASGYQLWLQLGDKYLARSSFKKAEKSFRNLVTIYPYAIEEWQSLSGVFLAMGDFAKAESVLLEARSLMPQEPSFIEGLGRLALQQGEKEKALALFRESLALKSDNPDLIAYMKMLEPKRKTFYADYDIPYESLKGSDAQPEDYPRHNGLAILDQCIIRANPNGTSSKMVRWVFKVLRRGAIQQESSHTIAFDPERQKVEVVRGRVIQPDGTIIDQPEINDRAYSGPLGDGTYASYSSKVVTLPQLQEGSIIDLQYTVEDTQENMYVDEFEDTFYIGSQYPTKRFEYVADIPKNLHVNYSDITDRAKPQMKTEGERQIVLWRAQDLPGVEMEPAMPPWDDVVPPLRISSFKDWNEVGTWCWNLSRQQMELPEDIKAKAHELVKDCKTREEKIAEIYYFIIDQIRYVGIEFGRFGFKPHKAERTYRARYGDCKDTAVLFCALLKEVGVDDARMVLVRTFNRGVEPTGIPGPRVFNHAIACVPKKDGGMHWLDGTTDYFTFGEVPSMDRGATALITGPEGGKLVTIDAEKPEINTTSSTLKILLDTEGKGQTQYRENLTGSFAPSLRRAFETPDRLKTGLNMMLSTLFPGATIDDFSCSGTDIRKADCWLSVAFIAPNMGKGDNGTRKVKPVFMPSQLSRRYCTQRERKHDMMTGFPWINKNVCEVHIPVGAKIESLPSDKEFKHEFGSFSRKVKRTAYGVSIEKETILAVRRLSVKDYAAFKNFCNECDSAGEEWVVYSGGDKPAEGFKEEKKTPAAPVKFDVGNPEEEAAD